MIALLRKPLPYMKVSVALLTVTTFLLAAAACTSAESSTPSGQDAVSASEESPDVSYLSLEVSDVAMDGDPSLEDGVADCEVLAEQLRERLNISEDYRQSFVHGDKGASFQKYIMLHDTEGTSDALSVIDWWDSNGSGVAAHFVINADGSIVQCVGLDEIAHHAGFGDTGHNGAYGVEDESRDDKVGTVGIGSWASDYGMNSYSVGIELVHMGGTGDYPEEQLCALDGLIAYIDAYYGFESEIIDHKAWRTGNSDTSPEFSQYLENYHRGRTHSAAS